MTITLPRALVQQVLEALDHEIDTRRCKASTLRAMISLRAALAQQAEHHCWCDVQMNEYWFEKLDQQMAVVDAAIALVEGRVKAAEEGK